MRSAEMVDHRRPEGISEKRKHQGRLSAPESIECLVYKKRRE